MSILSCTRKVFQEFSHLHVCFVLHVYSSHLSNVVWQVKIISVCGICPNPNPITLLCPRKTLVIAECRCDFEQRISWWWRGVKRRLAQPDNKSHGQSRWTIWRDFFDTHTCVHMFNFQVFEDRLLSLYFYFLQTVIWCSISDMYLRISKYIVKK